jgi:hypothetical protein
MLPGGRGNVATEATPGREGMFSLLTERAVLKGEPVGRSPGDYVATRGSHKIALATEE